jgi:hypothetical protein
MRIRFLPVPVLCASLIALAVPAFALDPFDFSSPREKSMGGAHVALADDFSVLLSNPAGLADMPKKFSAADLGLQAIGPVFDIADLVVNGATSTKAITDFLAKNNYKLYTGLDITGPLAFGYTGGGLGFGLFNKSRMTVNVASASSIGVNAQEDLLLAGGYAMRFDLGKGHELSAGVNAKGFVRGDITKSMGILEAVGLVSNLSSALSSPFTLTTGIGLDAGLRWAWKGRVAVGLVCHDIYSPAIVTTYSSAMAFMNATPGASSYDTLKRSLDMGLMWSPALGRLGQVIDSLVFALDYKDILDLASPVPRNPILNVGLGVEARVLEIVTLRAGIDEALLSTGIGLDLGVFTINLAAYGAELGLDPGDRPYYNLLVDIDFKY